MPAQSDRATNPPARSAKLQQTLAVICLIATLLFLLDMRARSPVPSLEDAAAIAPDIAYTINPNVATIAELTVLPGIGPARAAAIVAYREKHKHPQKAVFKTADDLDAVKGIGPVTVDRLRLLLSFDD